MSRVSAIVITFNEASNVRECLASLAWADEVIVVDSGSTDGTADLARIAGARVIVPDWSGYAAQNLWTEQAYGIGRVEIHYTAAKAAP